MIAPCRRRAIVAAQGKAECEAVTAAPALQPTPAKEQKRKKLSLPK